MIGKSIFDLLLDPSFSIKENIYNIQQSLRAVIHTQKAQYNLSQKFNLITGTLYFDMHHTPVMNNKGKMNLIMLTFKDVTENVNWANEKKELEKRV